MDIVSATSRNIASAKVEPGPGANEGLKDAAATPWLIWLETPAEHVGSPALMIGHADRQRGLLFAFQSNDGNKLLFKSNWRGDGTVRAEIAYRDVMTGRRAPWMAQRPRSDGRGTILSVAGLNIVGELADTFSRRAPDQGNTPLVRLAESAEGRAFLHGVTAAFVTLDEHPDPRIDELLAPFGVLATALQVATGRRAALTGIEGAVDPGAFAAMRGRCAQGGCLLAGKKFQVHADGLFDAFSDNRRAMSVKGAMTDCVASRAAPSSSMRFNGSNTVEAPHRLKDASCLDAPCFGYCGPGCITPGNIYTLECAGHDLCVCKYGHLACIYSVPNNVPGGCDGCYSLLDAMASFFSSFFSAFGYLGEWPEDPNDPTYFSGW